MATAIHPLAQPFYFAGGETGVLLVHGFTSSPSEMLWLGQELNKCGFTVSGPLLRGHGTNPQELQEKTRAQWIEDTIKARDNLLANCREVFLLGLSMGGLLCLMAWDHPQVRGIATLASPIYFRDCKAHLAPWVYPFYPYAPKEFERQELDQLAAQGRFTYDCYPVKAMGELVRLIKDVKNELPRIDKPLIIFQSKQDDSVKVKSATYIYERAASPLKEIHLLEKPGHIITMGQDKEGVRDKILAWMDSIGKKEG